METLYPKYSKEVATRLWKAGKMPDSFYIPNYMTEQEAWQYRQDKRQKEIQDILDKRHAAEEEKKQKAAEKKAQQEAEKKMKKDAETFVKDTLEEMFSGLNFNYTIKL